MSSNFHSPAWSLPDTGLWERKEKINLICSKKGPKITLLYLAEKNRKFFLSFHEVVLSPWLGQTVGASGSGLEEDNGPKQTMEQEDAGLWAKLMTKTLSLARDCMLEEETAAGLRGSHLHMLITNNFWSVIGPPPVPQSILVTHSHQLSEFLTILPSSLFWTLIPGYFHLSHVF